MSESLDSDPLMPRCASPQEAGVLHDLYRRSSSTSDAGRLALAERPGMVEPSIEDLEAGRVRVVADEGRIVGFAVCVTDVDDAAELDALFVDPAAWRRGIGRCLVDDAAGRARDDGFRRLSVTANPTAVPFYVALGFVADAPVDTDFGLAERMHLRLC